MSKRQRSGEVVVHAKAKRPIDKQVIVVTQTFAANTQTATTLYTSTFPGTATGILWDLTFTNTAAATNRCAWALVHVRQGEAAPILSFVDGAILATPEQNILSWGKFKAVSNVATVGHADYVFIGKTKTMRKLAVGDTLQVIYMARDGTGAIDGAVQFFIKT